MRAIYADENNRLWITKRNIATAIGVYYYELRTPINNIFESKQLEEADNVMWLPKKKAVKYYSIDVAILLSTAFPSSRSTKFRESVIKHLQFETIMARQAKEKLAINSVTEDVAARTVV